MKMTKQRAIELKQEFLSIIMLQWNRASLCQINTDPTSVKNLYEYKTLRVFILYFNVTYPYNNIENLTIPNTGCLQKNLRGFEGQYWYKIKTAFKA